MSLNLVNRVCRNRKKLNLSEIDNAVLIKFASLSSDHANPILADIKEISESIAYSVVDVQKALSSLLEKKLLSSPFEALGSKSFSNVYSLNVDALPALIGVVNLKKAQSSNPTSLKGDVTPSIFESQNPEPKDS